jgi:PD-(D/E)XK nuclease superfamily domain
MTARNTRTGGVLEQMVLPALTQGGYTYRAQVHLGQRLGCGRHFVDAVVEKDGRQFLLSVKWQQVSGTAEQKVPFEVICMIEALKNGEGSFDKAYLVLGGDGWTLRDFYTEGGLDEYIIGADKVEVLKLEAFIRKANQSKL